jgi:hypothetical protein
MSLCKEQRLRTVSDSLFQKAQFLLRSLLYKETCSSVLPAILYCETTGTVSRIMFVFPAAFTSTSCEWGQLKCET